MEEVAAKMETISAALEVMEDKKDNLRKAFEDLQSHSAYLPSAFNLTWLDLDSHFTSLKSSLETKFKLVQSPQQQPQSGPFSLPPDQPEPQPSSDSIIDKGESNSTPVQLQSELKSLCEKMDGVGLRNLLVGRPRERTAIRAELPEALRCASDPAAMVLDAVEGGFYVPSSKGGRDLGLCDLRWCCVVLLEELMGLNPEIGAQLKERAANLAAQWKEKVSVDVENPLVILGVLYLVAIYGLSDGFDMGVLIDFLVVVAIDSKYDQAIKLCRVLGVGDCVPDLIEKLNRKGKQLLAVKFVFEFDLADKFPPVPFLKKFVRKSKRLKSKRLSQKVLKDDENYPKLLNDAITKEVNALKSVIKIIEDHKLESKYPKDHLVKHIEALEKEKAENDQSASAPAAKLQQQSMPQEPSGSKRLRTIEPAGSKSTPESVPAASSNPPPAVQQSHLQPAGLLPSHPPPPPYLSSPAAPYGMAGLCPDVGPYVGLSAGFYGPAGASWGIPGTIPPSWPHVYPSEPQMPYGYFEPQIGHSVYRLQPPYHPSNYPL